MWFGFFHKRKKLESPELWQAQVFNEIWSILEKDNILKNALEITRNPKSIKVSNKLNNDADIDESIAIRLVADGHLEILYDSQHQCSFDTSATPKSIIDAFGALVAERFYDHLKDSY